MRVLVLQTPPERDVRTPVEEMRSAVFIASAQEFPVFFHLRPCLCIISASDILHDLVEIRIRVPEEIRLNVARNHIVFPGVPQRRQIGADEEPFRFVHHRRTFVAVSGQTGGFVVFQVFHINPFQGIADLTPLRNEETVFIGRHGISELSPCADALPEGAVHSAGFIPEGMGVAAPHETDFQMV